MDICKVIDVCVKYRVSISFGSEVTFRFHEAWILCYGFVSKNSFNLNLRQNVLTSTFNSVVFVLGTGVNFRPLFTSMSIMVLLKLLLDRFTTRGMLPMLVCRFFLANLGLCLAVGRMAKKNHFVYGAVSAQSFLNQIPSLLHFRRFCCLVSLVQVSSLKYRNIDR